MWQVISKAFEKSVKYGKKIELNSGTEVISNLQNVTYFKHFFTNYL
jgi:hypothetical protein